MSCSSRAARSSGWSRRARIAAWIRGCSVFDAAAEELRDLGQVLDTGDLDVVLRQVVGGSAARDDLDAQLCEPLRELDDARLVEGREQRPLDQEISSRTAFGSSLCSTAWTRARSDSTVSSSRTGTGSATITAPVSTPSST